MTDDAGVQEATSPGAECTQAAVFWCPGTPASTTEDCPSLNVRTPGQLPAGEALPVQVFFHGGGGINGAATDVQPDWMTTVGGNVVVTVNYRLGVLGGLSWPGLDAETPDGASSGNYPSTDKVAALEWVQHTSPRSAAARSA